MSPQQGQRSLRDWSLQNPVKRERIFWSFAEPQQKCGICLSKGEIQPRAGGTKHKGNSRDTPPASRDEFHPTGLILLPEEWFKSKSAGSSPGRAGAGPQHCRNLAANSSCKRHQDFSFHGFRLPGAGNAELHPQSYFLTLLLLDEVVVMV